MNAEELRMLERWMNRYSSTFADAHILRVCLRNLRRDYPEIAEQYFGSVLKELPPAFRS